MSHPHFNQETREGFFDPGFKIATESMRCEMCNPGNLYKTYLPGKIIQDVLINSIQPLSFCQAVLKRQSFAANGFCFTGMCNSIQYLQKQNDSFTAFSCHQFSHQCAYLNL